MAKAVDPALSTEEQAFLMRVGQHDTISREQAVYTARLMLDEVQKLDEGEFKLLDIGNMFLDCADQALTVNPGHRAVRTAMVFTTTESYKAEVDALRSLIQSDEPTG